MTATNVLSHFPGLFVVKDESFRFADLNDTALRIIGFEDKDDVLGLTDHDLGGEVIEHADAFRQEDQFVMDNGQLDTLAILNYADGNRYAWLTKKFAVRNEQNEKSGFAFQSIDLQDFIVDGLLRFVHDDDKMSQLPKEFNQTSYTLITEEHNPGNMTGDQWKVFFFLIRGYSSVEIASKIDMKMEAVEHNISQIKNKLGCVQDSQLVEYALAKGLSKYLPKTFIGIL